LATTSCDVFLDDQHLWVTLFTESRRSEIVDSLDSDEWWAIEQRSFSLKMKMNKSLHTFVTTLVQMMGVVVMFRACNFYQSYSHIAPQ